MTKPGQPEHLSYEETIRRSKAGSRALSQKAAGLAAQGPKAIAAHLREAEKKMDYSTHVEYPLRVLMIAVAMLLEAK